MDTMNEQWHDMTMYKSINIHKKTAVLHYNYVQWEIVKKSRVPYRNRCIAVQKCGMLY